MKKQAAEKSAAGDYAQSIGEGFDTYRNLREQGYSKEEAAKKSLVNAGVSLAGEKVLDKGGKWLNKQLPKGNVYGITADTDDFVDNFDSNNYNGANEKGELVNEFYDLLTDS